MSKTPPHNKEIMKIIGGENLEVKPSTEITVGDNKVKCYVDVNGEKVFSLPSIAKILGYGDSNKLSHLLDDKRRRKLIVDSGNGMRLSWFVDSLGLVSLIMKSRKLDDKIKLNFINKYFIL